MKKTITIAHLYYDIMNLYGESGNIKALKRFLAREGIEAKVYPLTIGDKIDFKKYDFYYMGCGNDENEELVLEDLLQYKDDIKNAIEDEKMFLITGNATELFGKKIRYRNGRSLKCLGIFEYQSCENERRAVSEVHYHYDKMQVGKGGNIFGFRNCKATIIHNDDYRLFNFASTIVYKNFYAMNFVGPFLIRNPYFTNMLIEKLCKQKNYEYKTIENTIEFKAYQKYYENFIVNSKLD